MKKVYGCLLALALTLVGMQTFGQEVPVGKSSAVMQAIKEQVNTSNQRTVPRMQLKTPGESLLGKINYKTIQENSVYVIGEIENVSNSTFFIRVDGEVMEGNILLRDNNKAYKYYSDNSGNAFVTEVNINEVICVNLEQSPERSTGNSQRVAALSPSLLKLESYHGGNGCVLLDFDGQYVSGTPWNGGNPIDALPSTLTEAQILEVWELVSEDYRPFHINITTSEEVFFTYPQDRRMRCVFTPTNTASPGAGGVALIGSFRWKDETPCWVFNGGVKGAGDAASHEVGHTFGLGHDGRTSPVEEYYQGQGSWAPIMGTGYYKPIVQWSKGEYANPTRTEDDLARIADPIYGIGYRTDDHSNTTAAASALTIDAGSNVNGSGVIERTGDLDFFSFATTGGSITLNFAVPARQANLDILATLYDNGGTVLATGNPTAQAASITATLAAGTYYVSITGTGAGDPLTDGYSNYGSLGTYYITGTVPAIANAVATFYQHCSFSTAGYAVGLAPGKYTKDELVARGILNNDVSSFTIQSGYEVTLYKGDYLTGESAVFTSDVSCLTTYTLNDSTSSILIRSAANASPVVTILSPTASETFLNPATVIIRLNTSDADGYISKAEFFIDTVKVGEDTSVPFIYTWSGGTTGTYSLTVKVTDDRGAEATAQTNVVVGTDVAALYQDCSFGGYGVKLAAGSYTLSQLIARGAKNDDISSLQIAAGYEIVLYQDNNFLGTSYVFRSDVFCLANVFLTDGTMVNINDWTSSVVIRPSTALTGAPEGPSIITAIEPGQEVNRSLVTTPNPFTNKVNVKYGNSDETFRVTVFNVDGRQLTDVLPVKNGQEVDLSTLGAGVYILKLNTRSDVLMQRIIKY